MSDPAVEGITVLVADDEAPARQRLLDLLARSDGIASVRDVANGRDAVDAITRSAPDVVFLDVQMPELDGLGVVAAVGADVMPLTVFVTAFDQHAIHAFEANAIDYLLKPFSDERFEATMARVQTRIAERALRDVNERLDQLLARTQTPARASSAYLERLAVKVDGGTRLISVGDIEWIEAAGVYVTVHVGAREFLHRVPLSELEARLDPRQFVRIHRSAIVNLEGVLRLEPLSHGEFEVMLRSGGRARLSRTYRASVEARLGQSL